MFQRLLSLTAAAPAPSPVPTATVPQNTQPSEIDNLLQKVETLKGNQNYAAIRNFLLRLKKDGFTNLIRNDAIQAYLFGTCRLDQSGRDPLWYLHERTHVGTPLFYANSVAVGTQRTGARAVVLFHDSFLVLADESQVRVLGTVGRRVTVLLPNGKPYVLQPAPQAQLRTQSEREAPRRNLQKLDRR